MDAALAALREDMEAKYALAMKYYQKGRAAIDEGNDEKALLLMLIAKGQAMETGPVSLVCDFMSEVGEIRTRLNKKRKKQKLSQAPINTFAASHLSDSELRTKLRMAEGG